MKLHNTLVVTLAMAGLVLLGFAPGRGAGTQAAHHAVWAHREGTHRDLRSGRRVAGNAC